MHLCQPRTLAFWRGRLPHWQVAGGTYFVTLHLGGIIPQRAFLELRRAAQDLHRTPSSQRIPFLQSKIFHDMERWLDQDCTNDYLIEPRIARSIMEAVRFRSDNRTWDVSEYVIMPTHLHILFSLLTGSLKDVLESFKERTGREALAVLGLKGRRFWQREWFDHWIRTPEEREATAEYIRQNPVKAGLEADWRRWPYGSWSKRRF